MIDQPHLAQSTEQLAAVIHLTIPREKIGEEMGPAFQELMATLGSQGIAPAGPAYSYHFAMHPETFDFEVGIPVAAKVEPAGRVKPGRLPATKVARTMYRGPYEELAGAWGELTGWIETNGHKAGTNLWERYVAGPESGADPANWQTELNRTLVS